MKIVGIIPAHLASMRFPRKVLHLFNELQDSGPVEEALVNDPIQRELLSRILTM